MFHRRGQRVYEFRSGFSCFVSLITATPKDISPSHFFLRLSLFPLLIHLFLFLAVLWDKSLFFNFAELTLSHNEIMSAVLENLSLAIGQKSNKGVRMSNRIEFFISTFLLEKIKGIDWENHRSKNDIWIIHGGTRKITVCSSTFYGVTAEHTVIFLVTPWIIQMRFFAWIR